MERNCGLAVLARFLLEVALNFILNETNQIPVLFLDLEIIIWKTLLFYAESHYLLYFLVNKLALAQGIWLQISQLLLSIFHV